jgi:ABC-type proline/glycine betaine transport system permease subunit
VWANPPDEGGGAWTRFLANRPGPRLRPLLYSPAVPSDAVATDGGLRAEHPRLVRAVTEGLVSLGQSDEGRRILRDLNHTDGFVPSNSAQYNLVREAFRATREAQARGRSGRFDDPRAVQVFALLVVCAALLGAGLAKRWPRAQRALAFGLFAVALVWAASAATITGARFLQGLARHRAVCAGHVSARPGGRRGGAGGHGDDHSPGPGGHRARGAGGPPVWPARGRQRDARGLGAPRGALLLQPRPLRRPAHRGVDPRERVRAGAFPGVGALAIHTVGSLGKQFFETLETMDPGPVEAMRAVGCTRLQVIRWGLWPQFAPHFVSQTLFRFELNVRGAVVLGLVGAQGIGFLSRRTCAARSTRR